MAYVGMDSDLAHFFGFQHAVHGNVMEPRSHREGTELRVHDCPVQRYSCINELAIQCNAVAPRASRVIL